MDERLKGIQAKFDVVQEILEDEKIFHDDEYCEVMVNTLGSMMKHAEKFDSFEKWYESQGKGFLEYMRSVCKRRKMNIVDITQEDLEFLYKHLEENEVQRYRHSQGIGD